MTVRFNPHTYASAMKNSEEYAVENNILYRWEDTHWQALDESRAMEAAYRWLVMHDEDQASADNAKKAVRSALLWVDKLPLPSPDVLIPCLNGYVHIVDGKLVLRPADRQFGVKHVLDCEFHPNSSSPRQFIALLNTILPDRSVQSRVQEYVGYTLMADARYQRAQFWLGSGANGKGTLANIVQRLHRNVAATNLNGLDGFRLWPLIDASLIFVDEAPKGRINEDLLKSLIPGETVQVDRKFEKPVSVRILGKWLVLGNQIPAIADPSDGFWRKWDFVPFDVTIPASQQDPELAEKIVQEELSGVLSWALEGLMRLQRRGKFEPILPMPMQGMLDRAKQETNSVMAWFKENDVGVSNTALVLKDAVFAHYRDWCEHSGMKLFSLPQFWLAMRNIVSLHEERKREHGRQPRYCNLVVPSLPAPASTITHFNADEAASVTGSCHA